MARKSFKATESQIFEIMDEDGKIGELLVKPSGIAWKAKNKQSYKSVTIEQFAEFAEQNGKDIGK